MRDLPTGTVTFLFTDIEGSTRLLQRLGDRYRDVVDGHGRILGAAIVEGGGGEVKTEGDSFFAVFPTPAGALPQRSRPSVALAAPCGLTISWLGPDGPPHRGGNAGSAMTTLGSMCTWALASPPRATAGRSCSPRQPGPWSSTRYREGCPSATWAAIV